MPDNMLDTMIVQAPNFVGFIILSLVMWRIISRQLDMIETFMVDCLDDDDTQG